jgi:hypothetical protein
MVLPISAPLLTPVVRIGSLKPAPVQPRHGRRRWVNIALGNIEAAVVGTYSTIEQKHGPRYLAEFEYSFKRRYDLAAMLPRLAWSSVRTRPMPYRLLKLPEVNA